MISQNILVMGNVNKERLAKIVYRPIQYLVAGIVILAFFLLCRIQQEKLRWLFETAFGVKRLAKICNYDIMATRKNQNITCV